MPTGDYWLLWSKSEKWWILNPVGLDTLASYRKVLPVVMVRLDCNEGDAAVETALAAALGGAGEVGTSRCTMVWCLPWQLRHLDRLLHSAVLCPGARQLKHRWFAFRWSDRWGTDMLMNFGHRKVGCFWLHRG